MEQPSIDELLGGTPILDKEALDDLITENDTRTKEAASFQQQVEKEEEEAMEPPQASSPEQVTQTPTTQQDSTSTEVVEPTQEDTNKTFAEAFAQEFKQQKIGWKNPTAIPAAAGMGLIDSGTGLLNLLPGVNIPQVPQYTSTTLTTVRDLSSLILPMLFVQGGLTKLGKTAHKAKQWKLGNDAAFKWFAKTGIGAGSGVLADTIAPVQERDHNMLGFFKKSWPQTWGWVPDDIATLDADESDLKRIKNRNEGLMLGITSDIILGFARLARGLRGTSKATKWVAENEKAKQVIDKFSKEEILSEDPIENAVLNQRKRRYDEFTELGAVNITNSVDLDQPLLGVHDAYDWYESGIRSTDKDGIFGASVDVVKIANNINTIDGRVGSVVSDGALQLITKGNEAGITFIKSLANDLANSKYGYQATAKKYLSHDVIVDAGKSLAADLYRMDVVDMDNMLKKLGQFGTDADSGARVLTSKGYVAVVEAMKKYTDDFINMDIARAQAYVSTSLAGQVSDMAQGSRDVMVNTSQVQRAQDQILDRLQYLMMIKGQTSYARGRALNMLNLWNRLGKDSKTVSAKVAREAVAGERNTTLKNLQRISAESKETIDTLRALKAEKPEMLGPLMLAYELTDGNVRTVGALNDYVKNSLGVFKKAIVDTNPELPSAFMTGVWSNIYNSVLSSFGTPSKAALSNISLMIERPLATWAGAMISGDQKILRRASYMYNYGLVDTLQNSFRHMSQVFKRASTDPGSVGYIMKKDFARANEDQIILLREFANAKESNGEFGPSIMVNMIEEMNNLSEHPALRFSANAMSAFDGFTKAFVGQIEARGKAFDFLNDGGKIIDEAEFKKYADETYKQMFDETGIITDEAVDYASREIAMNLDNKAVNSLSDLIKRAPGLKPFLMFPKTSMNMLKFTGSHNPAGLFVDELNQFGGKFHEITFDKAKELLAQRGVHVPPDQMENAYNTIRAELKGRKAIGTIATLGAVGLFTQDRLHGNGLYDKTKQRTRREVGWEPRKIKGLDGNWYSVEFLGPVADWLFVTADIMDNYDMMDEPTLENNLRKVGFLLGANLTNKSFTAGLEPLFDVLSGNPGAINRWTASFGNSLFPLSGQRNELGRLITPQLKEVEMELGQLWANRNPILKDQLPDMHDYIDGGKIKEPDNLFTRLWNTYSPTGRVSGKISPEKQFLIDIEFDGRPSLIKGTAGVEYTPDERSEVTRIMGEQGHYKKAIQQVMNSKYGKNFVKEIKEARLKGVYVDPSEVKNVHKKLNMALRKAQKFAERSSPLYQEMRSRINTKQRIDKNKRVLNVEEIIRLQQPKNN